MEKQFVEKLSKERFDNGQTAAQFTEKEKELLLKINVEDQCAICLGTLNKEEIKAFPCLNHEGHKNCIKAWIESLHALK